MEILLSLLLKLLPYLAVLAGLAGAYFHVKHKGALQERAKWEAATLQAATDRAKKVALAVGKDSEIDKHVEETLDAIKKAQTAPSGDDIRPGGKFSF